MSQPIAFLQPTAYSLQPFISVLMTVFNAESYLAASIESILKQTFTDWEFLIVDDGSTDRSVEIAENYAAKDHRLRVIRNDRNKGQTACLNQGLKEARGIWIARQDADDLSHPQRLEKQLQRIDKEPSLALLGTCGIIIDQGGCLVGLLDMPLTHEVITWSASMNNPFLHTSVLFRREVAQALGGYDERYCIAQDYDLWTRIMRKHRVANLPERLVSYRHLESSLSKAGSATMLSEVTMIAQREKKLKTPLQKSNALVATDHARFQAISYLKSAGSSDGGLPAMITKIGRAFFVAPLFTLRWLWARFKLKR